MRDLENKVAFIAGVGDDQGFGWAIAKALAERGATILVGTWTPILKIFSQSLEMGKFDTSRRLSDGTLLTFAKIYPLDAVFDTPDQVPSDILENKRYKEAEGYTISEVSQAIHRDFGRVDILIHSLANGPEVKKPLLETSRAGYLAAISSSAYSFISLLAHLGPMMPLGSAALTLTYLASTQIIPGYGGGMSSAKAALESDTRTLAWEAGRKWGIRVNAISAGPLGSRAARAIGFIEKMIAYAEANAPLSQSLTATDIGHAAAFLCSPQARAITGTLLYVDNGLHAMGVAPTAPDLAVESP